LTDVLNKFGRPWTIKPGDGAFYGPKIDIQVTDALRRKHQCATIQLDFQLPIRFDLQFKTAQIDKEKGDLFQRPVIIHRAILGSLERFIAVLTEHIGGKWPFWLSPRQVMIVPVTAGVYEYASEVQAMIRSHGYFCDTDLSNDTLNKKIRNAQLDQYNFILVVGFEEFEKKTVNIRTRDNERHGEKSLEETLAIFKRLCDDFVLDKDVDLMETTE
jgi:threonyl-tRNA synthetase